MINLSLNVYHKPAHSFSYVHYRSSHLQHTKINIVLSLEQQRIICLVSENKEQYLNKLRSYIIQHGLPKEVQYYTIIKLFSPYDKVKMNQLTILLLFRLTTLALGLTKTLITF